MLLMIICVVGSDTEVGKSEVSAQACAFLRDQGLRADAVKPFCCGGTEDLRLLAATQNLEDDPLSLCLHYFEEPIAPAIAAHAHGIAVNPDDVQQWIERRAARADVLIVETAGGLLSPLGDQFTCLDLCERVTDFTLVVSPDRLGAINQLGLVDLALQSRGITRCGFILNDLNASKSTSDPAHAEYLHNKFAPKPLVFMGFRPKNAPILERSKKNADLFKKALAGAIDFDKLMGPRSCGGSLRSNEQDA